MRSSLLSIPNPIAIINFSREGFTMVGEHNPMNYVAVSNALCTTRSC